MEKRGLFNFSLLTAALAVAAVLFAAAISMTIASMPALKTLGLKFFFSPEWDPVANNFGALPFLVGTLITSFLALFLSLPFSLSISILTGEYIRGSKISSIIKISVDLIAAVPSVIYGFWGLEVLVPLVRKLEMSLGVAPYGVGIFTASLILSIMIIPNTASLAREVIELVPSDLKEAAYALGATRTETLLKVVLPYARGGIMAGILLSLGRALGETMAVTMVIGNSNLIPKSLFAPANTMASVIANEFTEATGDLYYSSLIAIGLTLFIITAIFGAVGRYIVNRMKVK